LRSFFEKLFHELDDAHIYDEEAMPKNIVRLNSFVKINSKKNGIRQFELVIPTESDPEKNKISILTAMGVAILGRSEGDVIYLDLPFGKEMLTIEKVVQYRKPITLTKVL